MSRKTASLFKAGATIGARLCNASETEVEALAQYGFNIGLAFQITDDILDLTGNVEQLGKTAGIDIEQGKGFASVYENENAIDTVKQRLLKGNRLKQAQAEARNLTQTAISTLGVLSASQYKDALLDLTHLTIDREF